MYTHHLKGPSDWYGVDQSTTPESRKDSSTNPFGYVGMSRPKAKNPVRTCDNNPSNMGSSATSGFGFVGMSRPQRYQSAVLSENMESFNRKINEIHEKILRVPNIWTGRNLIDENSEDSAQNLPELSPEEWCIFNPITNTIQNLDNSRPTTEIPNGHISSRDMSVFAKVMEKVSDEENFNPMKCKNKTECLNKIFYDILDESDVISRDENESISSSHRDDDSSASPSGACGYGPTLVDENNTFVPGQSFYTFETQDENNQNCFRVYKNPSSVEVYYEVPDNTSIFRPTIQYAQSLYVHARSSQHQQSSSSLWERQELRDMELQMKRSSLGLVLDVVSFVNNTINVLYEKNQGISQEDILDIMQDSFQYRLRDFKSVKFWREEKTIFSEVKSIFQCYQFSKASPYAQVDLKSIPQCCLKPLWYSRSLVPLWDNLKMLPINPLWEILSFINILITRTYEEHGCIDAHTVVKLINHAMSI